MSATANAFAAAEVQCLGRLAGDFDPLSLHAADPERFPFFLESSAGAAAQGRYDIVFALPGEELRLDADGMAGPHADQHDFFQALDAWYQATPSAQPQSLPFAGGWFLYLSYEAASQVEPSLALNRDDRRLPVALAVRCRGAVVRDRRDGSVWVGAEQAGDAARLRCDVLAVCGTSDSNAAPVLVSCCEDPPERYRSQVEAAREYIRAGDIFQANLSREWRARLGAGSVPTDLYAALRRSNPAPFSGLMQWRDSTVISSSPERLIRLRNGWAETRPIAGTRARTGGDAGMTAELLAHPKERAEHVMLIDLERNDLGRVCEYGSIAVNELMTAESYAHVHHIVSNVRGRLRAGLGPGAALRAVFPGGTITGCPKVRCMEIIDELENAGRGAYTGSFGYLGLDGAMDSNILIRTLVQQGREVSLRAGAGIVADSDPGAELEETRAKARGMLLALGAQT